MTPQKGGVSKGLHEAYGSERKGNGHDYRNGGGGHFRMPFNGDKGSRGGEICERRDGQEAAGGREDQREFRASRYWDDRAHTAIDIAAGYLGVPERYALGA